MLCGFLLDGSNRTGIEIVTVKDCLLNKPVVRVWVRLMLWT